CREIDGSRLGQGHVDGAAVRGKCVGAAAGTVAAVGDVTARGTHADLASRDVDHLHGAAGGSNLHVAIDDIRQVDERGYAAHMHVGPGHVAHHDLTLVRLECDVAGKAFHCDWGRGCTYRDGGSRRNRDFVIHFRFVAGGRLVAKRVSAQLNAAFVGRGTLIDFDLGGVCGVNRPHLVPGAAMDVDRAAAADHVDGAAGSNIQAEFFAGVRSHCLDCPQGKDGDSADPYGVWFHWRPPG